MKPVIINSRLGKVQGFTDSKVAYFDRYDTKAGCDIRHFILLEESIKLMYEPWGWINKWYADLVKIEHTNTDEITLTDLCLDVIIEGNGPTYKIIDLNDFAEALASGLIGISDVQFPLMKLQTFLDNHLHDSKDFPPSIIKPYLK